MTDPRRMSEDDLLRAVLDLAVALGYRRAHFRAAQVRCRSCKGHATAGKPRACASCKGAGFTWRTPVQGDGAGFCDLVLVRRRRLLAVELKSDDGLLTGEQIAWLDALAEAGAETFVWRPAHWRSGEIERALKAEGRVGRPSLLDQVRHVLVGRSEIILADVRDFVEAVADGRTGDAVANLLSLKVRGLEATRAAEWRAKADTAAHDAVIALDALEDTLYQVAAEADDGSGPVRRLKSEGRRAHADAIRLLAAHGRCRILTDGGRVVVADIIERGSPTAAGNQRRRVG